MSLPLDILTTKYIKLKTNFCYCFFFLSSQTVLTKLFQKKPKIAILFLLKNPKHFAKKEKSAVLVFRH